MPLTIGTRLGSLEITELLGKGGMGEVYRALDTKLKREVAIKILPDEFSLDPDRVGRFQREAEVLASLSHPNIAAIHSLEEESGSRFLVLELVEGETLAERIRRGALPIDEALQIAKGICEALEAAHEKGVIHRDLKPANVKVTPEGKVKVLDFGLAKALDNTPAGGNLSQSPTMSMASFAATQAGVILGTAAYMSPEQAKGLHTDQRSDIFSFGAVLYEMLTGRQAFQGDSVSEVLASILAREPDLGFIPPSLNPRIRELLRRSLEKNSRRRWHAIGDLRMEMEAVLAEPRGAIVAEQSAATAKPLWKHAIPVLAAVVLTAGITSAALWYFRPSPPMPVRRFSVVVAEGQQFTARGRKQVAISPDDTQIVYVANLRLYRRAMSELEASPIAGTEGVSGANTNSPEFSPDGQSLVFWAGLDQTLKTIAVSGGAPVTICPAENPFGVSWGEGGIVFGQGDKGIMRVSEGGGKPELLVSVKNGEIAHGPQILPGGESVLYTLATAGGADQWDKAQIIVQGLKAGGERKPLIQGSDARYISTGHIVYALGGVLFAVPFDLRRLEITGLPVPVVKGVLRSENNTGAAHFSVSNLGTLIYIPGPVSVTGSETLATLGRNGGLELLKLPLKSYGYPRVSPTNSKLVAFSTEDGKEANVWIYDLAGTTSPRQLTFGSANSYPIWSADGEWVAFQSDRDGDRAIFRQRADGKGRVERLTKPEQGVAHIPDSWSPDGKRFSYTAVKGSEGAVWIYSLQDGKSTVFAQKTSAFIGRSAFSPVDGRWLAYQSNEMGKGNQIFVEAFPNTGEKYPVVAGGHPFWSPDQRELFYTFGPGSIRAVSISTQPTFRFSEAAPVPDGLATRNPTVFPRFSDITPDGKHFIGVVAADYQASAVTPAARQIHVVFNWFEELKRLMLTP